MNVHVLIPCPALLLQDCELLYVAFDLLHNGRTALTERPLSERLELLRRAVVPGEAGATSSGGMCVWRALSERQTLLQMAAAGCGSQDIKAGQGLGTQPVARADWGSCRSPHLQPLPPHPLAVPLNGSSVCGRVVPLIPGETRFNAALASRYGSTEQDIKDMLNEASVRYFGKKARKRGKDVQQYMAPSLA